jgi:hypothetical protein
MHLVSVRTVLYAIRVCRLPSTRNYDSSSYIRIEGRRLDDDRQTGVYVRSTVASTLYLPRGIPDLLSLFSLSISIITHLALPLSFDCELPV